MKKLFIFLVCTMCLAGLVLGASTLQRFTLKEGETHVFEAGDGSYIVRLILVSKSTEKAKFTVNGEVSDSMKVDDEYEFSDGSQIILKRLYFNDGGGYDEANFYFYGTGKNAITTNVSLDLLESGACNYDRKCGGNETEELCCYDCGCVYGECIDNKCSGGEVVKEEGIQEEVNDSPIVVEEETKEQVIPEENEEENSLGWRWAVYGLLLVVIVGIIGLWQYRKNSRKI